MKIGLENILLGIRNTINNSVPDYLSIGFDAKGAMTGILASLLAVGSVFVDARPANARVEMCQPGVSVDYNHNSAKMIWKNHELIIKENDGMVEYKIDNRRFKRVKFKNKKDLNKKLENSLDHEIGRRRKRLGGCFSDVYDRLNLDRYSQKAEKREEVERQISDFILDAKIGEHKLSDPGMPLTYLLVRNENTSSFYCLSLVQEVFDMVYGLGEAKRAGLYSARFAEDLSFQGMPVDVQNFSAEKHRNLKKGSIVRYNRGVGSLRSIGISLGEGKVAHIIGDTVYVSKISFVMDEGWFPKEIVVPDNSFKERNMNPVLYQGRKFAKRTTLEQIAPAIKKSLRLTGNYAAIEETLYQLNKDKFTIAQVYGGDSAAVLKYSTTLMIPGAWRR